MNVTDMIDFSTTMMPEVSTAAPDIRTWLTDLIVQVGKRADGLPAGKQSAPPMDSRNGGVTSVLPTFKGLGIWRFRDLGGTGGGEGLGLRLPDGKQSAQPMDTRNFKGLTTSTMADLLRVTRGFGDRRWGGYDRASGNLTQTAKLHAVSPFVNEDDVYTKHAIFQMTSWQREPILPWKQYEFGNPHFMVTVTNMYTYSLIVLELRLPDSNKITKVFSN
ncbi:unnamed protein product [Spodoptera exigua]|nr:unnamed protein product [Spodoptera exigua]